MDVSLAPEPATQTIPHLLEKIAPARVGSCRGLEFDCGRQTMSLACSDSRMVRLRLAHVVTVSNDRTLAKAGNTIKALPWKGQHDLRTIF